MDIDDAVEFFKAHPRIHHALKLLLDVGLGYLTLGQQSPTLSRRRSPTYLVGHRVIEGPRRGSSRSRFKSKHTLYVLDEPT